MKKITPAAIVALIVGIVVGIVVVVKVWYPQHYQALLKSMHVVGSSPEQTIHKKREIKKESLRVQSLFVPNWQLGAWLNPNWPTPEAAQKRYIYFAIPATEFGLDTDSDGYKDVRQFLDQAPQNAERELTISMTNPDENYKVFDSEEAQQTIIEQSLSLAKDNGFSGVVLDLEMPPLLSDKVPASILSFSQEFAKNAKAAGMRYSVVLFGDTFYRNRPFQVRELAAGADEVYVMAYDFHKPSGEPGPNFPFEKGKDYGYDFQHMVTDFSVVVPKEKLNIIYGMYGYDWDVTIEKKPLKPATVLTNREIQDLYENRCKVMNCVISRDPKTQEEEVEFIDENAVYHIVWHEDAISAARKTDYLLSQGIDAVAFWAYGYY